MAYIVSYQKFITSDITVQLDAPEEATELCTIDGTTYVSIPDDSTLPNTQPIEISKSVKQLVMTDEIRDLIKSESTHVQLIDERVKAKIAERYSITDEIKQLRSAPSDEFNAYTAYAEACREWGRQQKAVFGLANPESNTAN